MEFGYNNIVQGFRNVLNDKEFLEKEVASWKNSPQRILQIKGSLYYDGEHDILHRKRTAIGDGGELTEVDNLPNNRIVDNLYRKLVCQKANYLLGQPVTIEGENKQYIELLKHIFGKKFMRILKSAGKEAYNSGIAWLYLYYNNSGELDFKLFPGYEVLPFWSDSEHTRLDAAVRLYLVQGYEGKAPRVFEKAEVYDLNGVHCYDYRNGQLIPDSDAPNFNCAYAIGGNTAFNWERIPLIPIKYNEREIPLLKFVKTLQDGLNLMLSDFENNMQEDARNTILVLKNYDGTNLGEFRKNLATYGAVKVRYDGETKGGVETLEIKVNAENYKAIAEIFKKAIIENGMGYDAKDDRLSGNPNQMNIQSMYSDIDLDANDMETELQAAFEEILWFVNSHLANTGQGDFEGEEVTVIFNRDILINETEAIANCSASIGILSDETIVGMHPWVDDPQKELERLKKQKEEAQAEFERQQEQGYNPFGQQPDNQPQKGKGNDVNEE